MDNGGDSKYKNFIIYPKVMGKNNESNNVSGEISYWTNQEFKLSLLVNNKWYFYDFTCKFMCHETSSLELEQAEFFANFNPNPDDV